MNSVCVIDNRYIFPVNKTIQNEIEKRTKVKDKTKKTKNMTKKELKANRTPISFIGFGPVPATVTKDLSRTIMQTYEDCLNEIGPLVKKDTKEEESEEDTLFDGFFDEPVEEVKQKRKRGITEESDYKKDIYKDTLDRIGHITIETKVEPINSAIERYYKKSKMDKEFGCVGQLPDAFKANTFVFPPTLTEFVTTSFGQILVDFCDKNKNIK